MNGDSDAGSPKIDLSAVSFVGSGLTRPECVLATRRGDLYTADWRGGVACIRPDGTQTFWGGALPDGRKARPNGIALRRDGSFLLADLGEQEGGVFSLSRSGELHGYLEQVDGVPLPPSNFVFEDAAGRTWITVSTRLRPRALAYSGQVADGFIVLLDQRGARIVADGLGFANEAALSPDGAWLYVNETFARKLTRFRVGRDGSLHSRETVSTFGRGTYPDGLAFDASGALWITSIVSNRVIRVLPDGSQVLMLQDVDTAHVDWVEAAFERGELGRAHLDKAAGRLLKNISSLAFGGPDLKTAYLGCLLGDAIAYFRTDVAGHPPLHFESLPLAALKAPGGSA